MRTIKAYSIFTAIILSGFVFVSGAMEAYAARAILSATVNGGAAVSVSGGATIVAAVTVQTTGRNLSDDWQSTGWRIAASSGAFTCVNSGAHTSAGTYTANFNITAPAAAGTYNAYFRAYSGTNCTSELFTSPSPTLTLSNGVVVVGAVPALAILPTSLPSGTAGAAYSQALTASSTAAGTVSWSFSGVLPPGLVLNPITGAATTLSGTPTLAGNYAFSITAAKGSASSTQNYAVSIAATPPPPATSTLAITVANVGGTAQVSNFILTVKDGSATVFNGTASGNQSFAINQGDTYAVTEAATANSANYSIFLSANCSGAIGTSTVTCSITNTFVPPAIAINPANLSQGTAGTAYAQTLTASTTASGPFAWSIVSGSLPGGLSLGTSTSGTNIISGTPATSGTSTFTVFVTNGSSSSTRDYALNIAAVIPPPPPVLFINPASLPSGTAGLSYSQALAASTTASGPFSWSIASGNLPAGLSLGTSTGSTDVISGIPTVSGTSSFTVAATNGASSGTRAYALNILPAVPPPPATSTLTVNLTENGGTATASNFILTAKNGTSTIFSGSAASSQSYVLNAGSAFSVTEATTTNSSNYSIALGANCSGTIGTSTVTCAITNTFVAPPPPPVNLIANPSLESATASAQTPDHWNRGGWGTNTAQLNYPVPGVSNGVGVNVTITAYTNGDAKWYFDPVPVTAGATYTFSDSYNSTAATQVVVQFTMSDNSVSYVLLAAPAATNGAWATFSQQLTVPPNAVSVTVFHLLNSVGSLNTDNFSLTLTGAPGSSAFAKGIVSLTFDDGWQSQMDNAIPIMDAAGIHGTFYIIGNAMADTADGYMSASTVLALQNAHGEEIGGHTMDHCDLVQLYNNPNSAMTTVGCPDGTLSAPSTAQFQIDQSRTVLQTLTGAPIDTFAYPYGSGPGNSAVEGLVQADGFVSGRSVFAGYNLKSTDHYALLTQSVDTTVTTSTIHSWIDYAIQNKVWLTLMLHQVELTNAILTQNGEAEGTTKAVMQDIASYLQSKVTAGSVVVDTVHNVMSNYMK